MKLVPISAGAIRLGRPLPFALRTGEGVLLAKRGFVFTTQEEFNALTGRETLCIDLEESKEYQRALVNKMDELVRQETTLGRIAESRFDTLEVDFDDLKQDEPDDAPPDWLNLQSQANTLLRDVSSGTFPMRLDRLQSTLNQLAKQNPDATLFALIHLTTSDSQYYSATHAMLVSVMCGLAARDVLNWPPEVESILVRAALTMNVGMTELQDQLSQQSQKPTTDQRRLIDAHPQRAVAMLKSVGINDPTWLNAVLHHHDVKAGPLSGRDPALRLARLIHRADGFAARLSPRASRSPMAPSAAMQATYFDEGKQVDEAGAALIKAVGIYPPGSFVKLATNEIAAVVRRGANSLTPRVAVLVNKSGLPMGEPIVRDTRNRDYRIVGSVAYRELRVRPDLQRLLALI